MRKYVTAVAATAGIMAAAAGLRAAGSAIPTVDTFRNAYVTDTVGNFVAWIDRIRSDSNTPGVIRSYRGGTECVRSDVSGGSYLVPDARFIASHLFARTSVNGTPLTLVLNLAPDFRHNEFELDFEQNLPITVVSPTTRTLAGSTLSIADLYRISGSNKRTLLGQYRMPFQVTVQQ